MDGRGFVKLRVVLQEGVGLFGPGLVAQEVNLGNEADVVLAAGLDQFVCIGLGERVPVLELGVGLVGEVPVYAQDEEVHLGRGQVFLDEPDEQVYVPGRWCLDGEAPDGELVCCVGGLGY